jgi:hypothetical protein
LNLSDALCCLTEPAPWPIAVAYHTSALAGSREEISDLFRLSKKLKRQTPTSSFSALPFSSLPSFSSSPCCPPGIKVATSQSAVANRLALQSDYTSRAKKTATLRRRARSRCRARIVLHKNSANKFTHTRHRPT